MSEQVSPDSGPKTVQTTRTPFSLKKLLIAGVILLVLAMAGFNVYRIMNKDVVAVSAARVTEQHLVEMIPASGTVAADDKEIIYSEVSGTVQGINVRMGDKVTAGQVLLDLYIPNAEQRLAEARSALASAESALYQVRSGGKTSDQVVAEFALSQAESAYDNSITREQVAAILYKYAQYQGYDVSVGEDTNILSYNDAFDISEYAYPALQWTGGTGIIVGDDYGNLNPLSSVTRAEVAAILARFSENAAS